MGANKRLGRWLLYGPCLAPAVIMLGYLAAAAGSRRSQRPRAGMWHKDSVVSGRQADALHH